MRPLVLLYRYRGDVAGRNQLAHGFDPAGAAWGRRIDHPRGRVLGGSAALNVGSWSRGIAPDYDAWEAAGATGWGWPSALQTFQQLEASTRPAGGQRGRSGPMRLEDTPVASPMTDAFRQACLAAGFGTTADHNGAKFDGFDLWETIFPGGRRHNSDAAFLAPDRSRANLTVVTGAFVTRLLIEEGRAAGVAYEVAGELRQAGQMELLLPPGLEQQDKGYQFCAVFQQAILHVGRHLYEDVAANQAVGFQFAQGLGEHLGGSARQQPPQLAVAQGAVAQVGQQVALVPAANVLGGIFNRTIQSVSSSLY